LQRPVATRERQLDWDCGRRSADRRVKRCQRRVRERTDENMTSWARLVARTRQKAGRLLFGQSWSSGGEASQLAAAQRGETGKMKRIPMCPVCAHEGTGTRRRGERRGEWRARAGRKGGKRRKKEGVLWLPLMCQHAHKAVLAYQCFQGWWEWWIGGSHTSLVAQPRRRPQPHQHASDTSPCTQTLSKKGV